MKFVIIKSIKGCRTKVYFLWVILLPLDRVHSNHRYLGTKYYVQGINTDKVARSCATTINFTLHWVALVCCYFILIKVIFYQKNLNLPGVVVVLECKWLCCVTQGCGSTVVALNSINLNLPGVVVWWWCGYFTDYNTNLRFHWVTSGCGNYWLSKHFKTSYNIEIIKY